MSLHPHYMNASHHGWVLFHGLFSPAHSLATPLFRRLSGQQMTGNRRDYLFGKYPTQGNNERGNSGFLQEKSHQSGRPDILEQQRREFTRDSTKHSPQHPSRWHCRVRDHSLVRTHPQHSLDWRGSNALKKDSGVCVRRTPQSPLFKG